MNAHSFSILVLSFALFAKPAAGQLGLQYSGDFDWNDGNGTLTFQTSGSMPSTKEGFFYDVSPDIKKIVIGANVRVQGGFRILFRVPSNPLEIVGQDRKTSVIYGTDQEAWTVANGISDSDKWKYGSVCVVEDAVVRVANLSAINPRGYNISGYAAKAVIHVDSCDLLDTRKGDNNNSDGFIGSAGSSIRNSLISTSDDAIKVYHDIAIEDVTIEHHRNGAPLQFGWGGEDAKATANIRNLTIKGVSPDGLYNMAPLTWERGARGIRHVTIAGLTIDSKGKMYNEEESEWEPLGLLELKPAECEFTLTVTDADLGGLPIGNYRTRGAIKISNVAHD